MSEFQDQVSRNAGFIYNHIPRGVFEPGKGVVHQTTVSHNDLGADSLSSTTYQYRLFQRALQTSLEDERSLAISKLAQAAGSAWEQLLVQKYSDLVKTVSANGTLSRSIIEDKLIGMLAQDGSKKEDLTLISSSPFEQFFGESFDGLRTWCDSVNTPRLDNNLNHVPFYKEVHGRLQINEEFGPAPWRTLIIFNPNVMTLEIPEDNGELKVFEPRDISAEISGTGFPGLLVLLQAALRPVQPTLGMVVHFKSSGPRATEFTHV